jgi:pimeloyl-ACP methyl ester carboxylesterase
MMSFHDLKKRSSTRHYFSSHGNATPHPVTVGAAIVVAAFAISALVNRLAAKKAERKNPPMGKFVEIEGVRLHYFERGEGEPLVLLHGNGSMIQDFSSSGLVDKAAGKYRVIVFDRPGFGYSERPRRTIWTPEAQANLICKALRQIGISRAIVLGHSWGASVATALALKYPEMVAGLLLLSDRSRRRCDALRPSGSGDRRHPKPYSLTYFGQTDVATCHTQALRTVPGA